MLVCWLWGLLGCGLGSSVLAQTPVTREAAPGKGKTYEARVTRVPDGDTLWVQPLPDGRYRKLRLDGVDAPEICQPGGSQARDALSDRLLQQVVTVEERWRDDYGRPLARLVLDGEDVAAWLVSQGHAWSHRWRQNPGPYAREEDRARRAGLGVFSAALPERPRDFRRRHGPCDPRTPGSGSGGAGRSG